MSSRTVQVVLGLMITVSLIPSGFAQDCIECHKDVTPDIVTDWQLSAHSRNDVDCSGCHGDGHTTSDDVADVAIPTPNTCADCHSEQVEQFKSGKHAAAWAAMKAMPSAHAQPVALMEGMKGREAIRITLSGTAVVRCSVI